MAIGNNDNDYDLDDLDIINDPIDSKENTTTQDITDPIDSNDSSEDEFINQLLLTRGIQDSSKIKFENDEGEIEEVDWNTLDNEDKLNIINGQDESSDDDLDDTEIELLNHIRDSKMTPAEYINYIQQQAINIYAQNLNNAQFESQVDNISDDELFITDLVTRYGDLTEDEAQNLLDNAKQNEELYRRLINVIRNEYKQLELANNQRNAYAQQQAQMEQYNNFAESIEDEIRAFTNVNDYDLNMDESEMEELYDFITGYDAAGVSVFGKALNDPRLLVKMAWFALNGDSAINDINDYWTNEIKQVRKNSYNQGVQDAKNGKVRLPKSKILIGNNNKNTSSDYSDDLDD